MCVETDNRMVTHGDSKKVHTKLRRILRESDVDDRKERWLIKGYVVAIGLLPLRLVPSGVLQESTKYFAPSLRITM